MAAPQNNFLVLTAEARPAASAAAVSQFLSLAPDVSASHPRTQRTRTDSDASSSDSAAASPTLTPVTVDAAVPVSNTRVLKLSPVHWGAHTEDHQADFHDLV
ncbi:hypothetical protein CCM_05487 [Cordyceps militaris CM01]|uniref:Uncharacterized protein n=2 Tax=Cordyceps militaris TaxID=73501 RepID=G3JJZ2_CORMM|nr:uncharacterized protein CCM_05487 [Cordyceps militaris CM01]ATY58801.1 hypothetical protein A9K55_002860 [Cordyceps militaris]EGX91329.1 hypothetical protein CCM_05487 [Cordyceps militaris CM01]